MTMANQNKSAEQIDEVRNELTSMEQIQIALKNAPRPYRYFFENIVMDPVW